MALNLNFGVSKRVGKPPCTDCKDRHMRCHAECDKYRIYDEKLKVERDQKRTSEKKCIDYAEFRKDARNGFTAKRYRTK